MSATKTMFGIPVSEVTKAKEAASAANPAPASGASPAPSSAPASVSVSKTLISTPSPAPGAGPRPDAGQRGARTERTPGPDRAEQRHEDDVRCSRTDRARGIRPGGHGGAARGFPGAQREVVRRGVV